MVRAVFLDRDGVINANLERDGKPVAPRSLAEFRMLPGVAAAARRLKEAGFLLVVVTNQPDVANGLTPRSTVDAMHAEIRHKLPIDDIIGANEAHNRIVKIIAREKSTRLLSPSVRVALSRTPSSRFHRASLAFSISSNSTKLILTLSE